MNTETRNAINELENRKCKRFSSIDELMADLHQPDQIDLIQDLTVTLTVTLGQRTLSLEDLSNLTYGSIIELDELESTPMKIFANGKMIAFGTAVVSNDHYGIKITEFI